MTLNIAPGLTLPIDMVTEPIGILANRGRGKSYTTHALVEEIHNADVPVVVLDVKGDWWGLRTSADGKADGRPARSTEPESKPTPRTVPQPVPTNVPTDGAVELRKGARRMVETLGRMHPLRLTKGQWGMVSGLKTSGGTWSTYLGEIRRLGFIDETPAGFTMTEAGFDYLGEQPTPMTASEPQDHYRSILRAGARRMLDALIDTYPDPLTREEISEASGVAMTGGTFSTYLGELVRNQLAERRSDGSLVATDILMHGASA